MATNTAKKNTDLRKVIKDNITVEAATPVLGGTATNPALYIETAEGKIYLNGKAKADADGNLIGTVTASARTVDSIKSKDTTITAFWMDSFQPDSLKIKQLENRVKMTRLNKMDEAIAIMDTADLFAIAG